MTRELIETVEIAAQEEIQSIHEHAAAQVSRITEEARAEGKKLKEHHPGYWKNAVAVERTRIVAAEEKARMELLLVKEAIFEDTYRRAGEELAGYRDRPGYKEFLEYAILEALEELDGASAVFHVDRRDEALCSRILASQNGSHSIVPDIETMGGVIAHTPDETIIVTNTLESRLRRSRDVLRKEIFAILDGGPESHG